LAHNRAVARREGNVDFLALALNRIDIWDDAGVSIVEHVAGVDDFEVAKAAYRAGVARWPAARIALRQGARVVMKSWTE
jgi:hypothetical protein